jgi:hypothetical protein
MAQPKENHYKGCYRMGASHYLCAMEEIAELRVRLRDLLYCYDKLKPLGSTNDPDEVKQVRQLLQVWP